MEKRDDNVTEGEGMMPDVLLRIEKIKIYRIRIFKKG